MPLDPTSEKLLSELLDALEVAIPRTYRSLLKKFPDLCGFAIVTTVSIENLFPAFQCAHELPPELPPCHERFSPAEWASMQHGGTSHTFGKKVANSLKALADHFGGALYGDSAEDVREIFREALLALFVDLEQQGKLGSKTDDRFLTIWEAGHWDYIVTTSELLNTATTHKQVVEHVR